MNRMMQKIKALGLSCLFMISSAAGALIAYDSFDYPLGTLIADGGTLGSATNGFLNAWKFSGYTGEVVGSISFSGSGNALKVDRNDGGYLFRGMDGSLSAGTYYMSMVFYRDDYNSGGSENWFWQLKHAASYSTGPTSSTKLMAGSTSSELVNLQVAGDSAQSGTESYAVGSPVMMLLKFTIDDVGAESASMKWYFDGGVIPEDAGDIEWDAVSSGSFSGGIGWRLVLPENIPSMMIDEFRLATELADVIPAQHASRTDDFNDALHSILKSTHQYRIVNSTTNQYLTVNNSGGYADCTPVELQYPNGQLTQFWFMEPIDGTQFGIRCLDASYYIHGYADTNGWNEGDSVDIRSWNNWDSQKWIVDPLTGGVVRIQMVEAGAVGTNFYLSSESLTNDTPAQIYSWEGATYQQWIMDLRENVQSPAIARGTDGALLSFFRYVSQTNTAQGLLYASQDDGETWGLRASFDQGIYGPALFVLDNTLYMLCSNTSDPQKLLLKKSMDHGVSWTDYTLVTSSNSIQAGCGSELIKDGILYYCFRDNGRLCTASCPVTNDITVSANWIITSPQNFPSQPAVSGTRNNWNEPNCVEGPDGRVWVIARVDKVDAGDVAAVLKVSTDRQTLEFTNQYPAPGYETGFIQAPWAGSSKFHIVYDSVSERYLVLSNPYLGAPSENSRHPFVRNVLALYETEDLKNYELVKTLINDDCYESWPLSSWYTGFQYPAFIVDGSTLKYVSRTAYNSFCNYHDANYATYHELENFRAYLSPDGEIAYYSFDDLNDPGYDFSKMRGSSGDIYGAAYVAGGKYGGCLTFDGVDDWVGLMNRVSPKLHRCGQVSLSVWIKNDTNSSGPVFTSAISPSSTPGSDRAGITLQVLNGLLVMGGRSVPGDNHQSRSFSFSSTGQWHHIVALWDFENDTMRLWLDQVEQAGSGSVSFGNAEYTRGDPTHQDGIGRHFNGDSFFDGCVDELHVFKRSLSQDEIADLYDGAGHCSGFLLEFQ